MAAKPTKKSVKRGGKEKSANPFVGRWIASDEWSTDVALIVARRNGKISVRAVDQSDGEEAEIFGVKPTKKTLSFAAFWSSGQFTKYNLRVLGGDLLVTFAVTATQTFKRG